jgi:hypothetical protein
LFSQESGGLEHLKNRFVKHVRARQNAVPTIKKSDVISVVRKQVDADGVVRLTEETFNYSEVRFL